MSNQLVLKSDVRCGFVLPGSSREEVLDLAPRIEAAGFNSTWVGDHISFHAPITESLTLLSFAAAITERVRLATSVYLLPLRHPVTSAKVIASLDMLSGGRVVLGVGGAGSGAKTALRTTAATSTSAQSRSSRSRLKRVAP